MGQKVPELMQTGANILSLDWTMNLRSMRQSIGRWAAVPGNLDPVFLTMTPDITRREALRVLDEAGDQPSHFNLGHGMIPVPRSNALRRLMEVVTGQKNA